MKSLSKLKRKITHQDKYIVYAIDTGGRKNYVCCDLKNIKINHMIQGEKYLTLDRSKAFIYSSKGEAENACEKFWARSVNIPTEVKRYYKKDK